MRIPMLLLTVRLLLLTKTDPFLHDHIPRLNPTGNVGEMFARRGSSAESSGRTPFSRWWEPSGASQPACIIRR